MPSVPKEVVPLPTTTLQARVATLQPELAMEICRQRSPLVGGGGGQGGQVVILGSPLSKGLNT